MTYFLPNMYSEGILIIETKTSANLSKKKFYYDLNWYISWDVFTIFSPRHIEHNEMRRNNTVIMKDQERTKTGLNIMENRLTKFK